MAAHGPKHENHRGHVPECLYPRKINMGRVVAISARTQLDPDHYKKLRKDIPAVCAQCPKATKPIPSTESAQIGNPTASWTLLPGLSLIILHGDLFHLLDFCDDNGVSTGSFKYDPGCPHVLADKRHEHLPLIRIGHLRRDREIEPIIFS